LGQAEAGLAAVTDKITSLKAKIDNAPKSFEKDVKGAIPGVIDCHKYEPIETDSQAS
jgi:hypothetical protein